jgi:hypothetical protein
MWYGCDMDVIWMWYECDMNVIWMWYECDMNVIWIFNGCSMDAMWIWYVQVYCWKFFNIVDGIRIRGERWHLAISLYGKMGRYKKVSHPHYLWYVCFDDYCFNWLWKMMMLDKIQNWHKWLKGVSTTIHMGISHHTFDLSEKVFKKSYCRLCRLCFYELKTTV